MLYYLDTEFVENGYDRIDDRIELLSIGLVAEDGREFYAEPIDGYDISHANDWVKQNVVPLLGSGPHRTRSEIREALISFVATGRERDDKKPVFVGYYCDYDWVLFCQLFGRMIDLPDGWPMWCYDIKQLAAELGDPELPKQAEGVHHALADARHIRAMHKFLLDLQVRQSVRTIPDRPRVVCLCGSTRFHDAFRRAEYEEEIAGRIVLSIGFGPNVASGAHDQNVGIAPEQKQQLDELHKRRIDMCDEIFVLNVGGYVGESTMSEIRYAKDTGRGIRWLEPELYLWTNAVWRRS